MTVLASAAAFSGDSPSNWNMLVTCCDILVAQLDRLRIGLQVVVAIGKAQPALIGAGNLHHGVLGVGLRAEIEQHMDAVVVQLRR